MSHLIGFDISTTYIGITVLNANRDFGNDGLNIAKLEHIDFKDCKTFWEKADKVKNLFEQWKLTKPFNDIEEIYVEDAAKRYSTGKTSADTIATLLKFNGLVSYFARCVWNCEPEMISVAHARKLCGLKMQQSKICQKTHKEQTFEQMMNTDLKHITWEKKKKSERIVDWANDIVDSYVIAKAGHKSRNRQFQT